jgi:RNA polymerase sigma factor (sigma-70 family)
MATTRAGTILRQLRGLTADRGGDAADGELLRRFTAGRDEAAFAVLVRRHGAMVLGVCRRVLANADDAEDAFQATFLALARKASAIRAGQSLGGWLYRVAYHAALKARRRAADRQRREGNAATRQPADPLEEVTGRELLALLDEEMQRLPERCRTPLVLCLLDGQTRDEAARRLGCSVSTLQRRVEEGKERLRLRLERRGLALGGALLVAGLGRAAVPAALASRATRTALLAASGKAVPAALVGLVPGALGAGAATRCAGFVALLAAVGLAAGVTALAARGPLAAEPGAGAPARGQNNPTPGKVAEGDGKRVVLAGRVLDEDDKPLAGAEVAILGLPRDADALSPRLLDARPVARTRADDGGRFRVAVRSEALAGYREVYALAGKAGHGLTWNRVRPDADGSVRLPREKVIRGRLLDVQGQPAVGVRVRVGWLGTSGAGSLRDTRLGAPAPDQSRPWPGSATTDRDGRFALHGLNPDLTGYVYIEDERFALHHVEIQTGAKHRRQEIHAVLAPAQVLQGVVTAKDTGKPVPHASVGYNSSADPNSPIAMGPGGQTQADERGRYRLQLLAGKLYTVTTSAPEGQPYLRSEVTFRWPQGAVKHSLDITLPRGVLIRGTVTDAATGRPVAGAVVHDAAHLWIHYVESGADGVFRFVVPPGRGHLLVKGPGNAYIATEVTHNELLSGKRSGGRIYPDAVIAFDARAGADVCEVKAQLRHGVTVRGRVVGPDGKPVAQGIWFCYNQVQTHCASWFGAAKTFHGGAFELRGCDPNETYPVSFLDPANQTGATVRICPKEAGSRPVTVTLAPCGRAVARLVDRQGKPRTGPGPIFYVVARLGGRGIEDDSDFVANVDRTNYPGGRVNPDAKGRCTYAALIPGTTYTILDNRIRPQRKFAVKPGETLDLGDVVIDQR